MSSHEKMAINNLLASESIPGLTQTSYLKVEPIGPTTEQCATLRIDSHAESQNRPLKKEDALHDAELSENHSVPGDVTQPDETRRDGIVVKPPTSSKAVVTSPRRTSPRKVNFKVEPIWLQDDAGESQSVDPLNSVLYLLDLSVPSYLPELNTDLRDNYRLPFLPAGKNCGLQYVNEYGRPPFGPNIYITPPGAMTWFHEDGHGTVDSGHQCLRGRNEVIILKRMGEEEKTKALEVLRGRTGYTLSTLPHDERGSLDWPDEHRIQLLEEMGAMPAVLTLEPGR